MPQPITHYLVIEEALTDAARNLWEKYRNFAAFGSFGPDLFYVKDVLLARFDPKQNYEALSDALHGDGSFDLFCALLDQAKDNQRRDPEAAGKQLAFALGYYSHVLTDCILHPYVYRRTQDHWKYHVPKEDYTAHKKLEAMIDCHILKEKHRKEAVPDASAVRCRQENNGDLLDMDIASVLNNALKTVYSAVLSADFQTLDINQPEHPIHAAYHDFHHIVGTTYAAQNILCGLREYFAGLDMLKQLNAADIQARNVSKGPWRPNGDSAELTYSSSELFAMAVWATKQVASIALAFWTGDPGSGNAQSVFRQNGIAYLRENWNLDTGLPARFNADPAIFDRGEQRYNVGVDVLRDVYAGLTK
ncbi:MAG TPA: zinc dependent phospholipase C family protein [Patescibacteria group bacterium]|nr:zinc dependent phospholipase C family protein [Patescibacteria group bacterium]